MTGFLLGTLGRLNLRERLDALGAKGLAGENTLIEHPHSLQVWLELVPGCTQ